MAAQTLAFQDVYQRISAVGALAKVRKTSLIRLALLVVGMIAAQSVVIAKVADALLNLELTAATEDESIERRLRRALADKRLDGQNCYESVLNTVVDWDQLLRGSKRVVLAIDESSKEDEVHLFRVSLTFWGHALPIAWTCWQQNVALPEGTYWAKVDPVLQRVSLLLPKGLEVIVLADKFYDIPSFVDRLRAFGWHWIVRQQVKGQGRFLDRRGREYELSEVIRHCLPGRGTRWKARGKVFKDAGWREASLVGVWGLTEEEPLVVVSDLPTRWDLLALFERRFWIEPGFRSDKRGGWQWEDTQVKGVEHNERLLLAMAWATLIVLCIGLEEAKAKITKLAERQVRKIHGKPVVGLPRHARESLFTTGLRAAGRLFCRTTYCAIHWLITDLDAGTWYQTWYACQAFRYMHQTVRP